MGGTSFTFTCYILHCEASDSDLEDSLLTASNMPKRETHRSTSMFTRKRKSCEKVTRKGKDLKMIGESACDALFCIDEREHILLTNNAAAKRFE